MIPIMPMRTTPPHAVDLPDGSPRLRVALSGLRILDANAAFGDLVDRPCADVAGTSLMALLAPSEHGAIVTRLDRVMRYGRDRIAAIALLPEGGVRIWCAIEAVFTADVDEVVDLQLMVLRRTEAADGAAMPFSDRAEPATTPPGSDVVDVLDHIGRAVVLLDPRQRVAAVNGLAAKLIGADPDALVGLPLTAVFVLSPQARESLGAAARACEPHVLRGGTPGGGRVVALRWIPARGGGGYVIVDEILPVDPSTRKLRADKFQVTLIAHDARRVLARMKGALGELSDALPADSVAARGALAMTETCYGEVAGAIALAFDLAKDAARDRQRLDAGRVVNGALAHLMPAATTAGVRVVAELADGLTISAPSNWIDRIVGNLVDNGIHHVPEGGTIHVVLSREDRERPGVHIAVTDTGPGVPKAERERVFEEGISHRPGGKGIGLFIVRYFTVELGGQVHCAERAGGGAAFHVWLPLVLADATRADPTKETIHG